MFPFIAQEELKLSGKVIFFIWKSIERRKTDSKVEIITGDAGGSTTVIQ